MKSFIRAILYTTLSLYLLSRLFPAIQISSFSVLVAAGITLTLLNMFVRPILKILFLPINLITLGLFSWLISIIVVYLATLLVPGFHIGAITIPPIHLGSFVFPRYDLSQFWSLFFVSFMLSLLSSVLSWFL